jgi:hypothetical protein
MLKLKVLDSKVVIVMSTNVMPNLNNFEWKVGEKESMARSTGDTQA